MGRPQLLLCQCARLQQEVRRKCNVPLKEHLAKAASVAAAKLQIGRSIAFSLLRDLTVMSLVGGGEIRNARLDGQNWVRRKFGTNSEKITFDGCPSPSLGRTGARQSNARSQTPPQRMPKTPGTPPPPLALPPCLVLGTGSGGSDTPR